MKIGIFYQSGYKLVACYKAVEQLRSVYPNAPIALYEDTTDILLPMVRKFNLDYRKTDTQGKNLSHSGRSVFDLISNIAWLRRIHEACTTTLKDVDWVIHYEDDVWCKRPIKNTPVFDIAGANGPLYTVELYRFLKNRFNITDESRSHWSSKGSLESYGACGGAIFNRESFILAYNKLNEIPWEQIELLDNRPLNWSDASLSFIMQHAGFTSGVWNEWGPWTPGDNDGHWWDKTGWTTPMSAQPDVAFLHGYKHFYNYAAEDLNIA